MNAQTLLLDSLNSRWDDYEAKLKTCRGEFSETAVHDFRVAERRLLAVLDLLHALIRDPEIQKIRRMLKDELDDLDDLRDIQALLAGISETIHVTPILRPFQKYLLHKEKLLLRVAHKEIKSLKIANLSKQIMNLGQTINEANQTDLDANLFPAVDEAYATVTQRYVMVDPRQPATIHRLRIAFKKFRYIIEAIYPMLQGFPAEHPYRMHEYQTAMGNIQDMEVALQELANFGILAPETYNPKPALSYYRKRHAIALSHYIKQKGEIITFWRAAPDQSFPQEKII
jgi:CHAD domain-containing protein